MPVAGTLIQVGRVYKEDGDDASTSAPSPPPSMRSLLIPTTQSRERRRESCAPASPAALAAESGIRGPSGVTHVFFGIRERSKGVANP
jgi:hypothetical protein